MIRKIIQIEVVTETVFGITTGIRQYALCDDGSIWYRLAFQKDSHWRLVDDYIPGTAHD